MPTRRLGTPTTVVLAATGRITVAPTTDQAAHHPDVVRATTDIEADMAKEIARAETVVTDSERAANDTRELL